MENNEDKIVLTLGAVEEEAKEEEVVQEPKVSEEEARTARVDDSSLSAEEKKMVEDFSKQIDISQSSMILQYGSAAQNKVADFSDTVIKNVKTKKTQIKSGLEALDYEDQL